MHAHVDRPRLFVGSGRPNVNTRVSCDTACLLMSGADANSSPKTQLPTGTTAALGAPMVNVDMIRVSGLVRKQLRRSMTRPEVALSVVSNTLRARSTRRDVQWHTQTGLTCNVTLHFRSHTTLKSPSRLLSSSDAVLLIDLRGVMTLRALKVTSRAGELVSMTNILAPAGQVCVVHLLRRYG
jgi:hypothetical protein